MAPHLPPAPIPARDARRRRSLLQVEGTGRVTGIVLPIDAGYPAGDIGSPSPAGDDPG